MTFPAEPVPDGNIGAPHHFYSGIIIAGFGFYFVWPRYPRIGATMAGIGLAMATDDYVSHAFGVWTPIDAGWNWFKDLINLK